ncbi:MAG TPA: hypothetical protein ENH82_02180 [bacterium]|nr:hypothetical protein [bacterium]
MNIYEAKIVSHSMLLNDYNKQIVGFIELLYANGFEIFPVPTKPSVIESPEKEKKSEFIKEWEKLPLHKFEKTHVGQLVELIDKYKEDK